MKHDFFLETSLLLPATSRQGRILKSRDKGTSVPGNDLRRPTEIWCVLKKGRNGLRRKRDQKPISDGRPGI